MLYVFRECTLDTQCYELCRARQPARQSVPSAWSTC